MCFFPGPLPPPSTPTPRLQWLQEGKLLVVGTHGDAEQMVVSFGRLFGSVLGGAGRKMDGGAKVLHAEFFQRLMAGDILGLRSLFLLAIFLASLLLPPGAASFPSGILGLWAPSVLLLLMRFPRVD